MIRIATRQSPLALWQANYVGRLIKEKLSCPYQLMPRQTTGDRRLLTNLAWQGGKGLFLQELQQDLLHDRADIAVHSMKDVPVAKQDGLVIVSILKRHSVEDVFISNHYSNLDSMPLGSIIGTSSLRRQSQLLNQRSDLTVKPLRGNINTRLDKLDKQAYQAIILAKAGLERLGLEHRICQTLNIETLLPAVAQGAIGVECRECNFDLIEALQKLNDSQTALCVNTEREVNRLLGGNCHAPIGVLATIKHKTLTLRAMVAESQGRQVLRAQSQGSLTSWRGLAQDVAGQLINQNALKLIQSASQQNPPSGQDNDR